MFYADGTFVANFHDGNIERVKNNKKSIDSYFKELITDSIECDIFHNSSYWGLYRFFHDTIKVQYINHPSKMGLWHAGEKWYGIIDRNTIVEINTKPIDTKEEIDFFYKYYYDKTKTDTAKFVPLSVVPSSDCWLKKEKWFWCNEEDWEHYMDSIGIER
ncbi:MAG: hypothetical protein GXO89_06300 [Chlorobi bacterium]|nr:hypothetical protein [Chlorobiota bacterium]